MRDKYRSAIYYKNETNKNAILDIISNLKKTELITQAIPLDKFKEQPNEDY